MHRSAHLDSFARDNLPPETLWPELVFSLPELQYPDRLNCADQLRGPASARGARRPDRDDRPGWRGLDLCAAGRAGEPDLQRAGAALTGFVAGNRVLLRAANTPMMVASYFAVLKAGGVVVASMPLLRAKELGFMIRKARISHALCDKRLEAEMDLLPADSRPGCVLTFQSLTEPSQLEAAMADGFAGDFTACDTAVDDVCLIGFTSGTTGVPKGTMHFHRDMLAICDTFSPATC